MSARSILGEFRQITAAGAAVIMATHDPDPLPLVDRTLLRVDGRVVDHGGANDEQEQLHDLPGPG